MSPSEPSALDESTDAPAVGAAALYEGGHRHLQAGRLLEAQLCCQQLLAAEPNHAGAMHLMGLVALAAGQFDHALEWTVRAIAQEPKPDFLASLGTMLLKQGRQDEALKVFDKAVQLAPGDASLWKQMGDALLDMQRHDHALLTFQHVLKLDPRHQDAAYKSGVLLHHVGRFEEAVAHLDLCDALLHDHAPTLQARARTLLSLRKFEAALADNLRADERFPNNADTLNNIGACLQSLGREDEALVYFERALALLPDAIEILNNKANILYQLQRFDEALALYDHIHMRGLSNATTEWNLALLRMLLGDFEPGWAGREARFAIPDASPYPTFVQPMWRGDSIDGKTILVHVDEGLGDTIQFVRYVPMLAARGARVILVVERPTAALLSQFPGVAQCLAFSDEPLPAFDMHCPIGSLPMVFGTRLETIPAETTYLPSPPEARIQIWRARLGTHDRLRVGLVWSGSRTHRNDHNRSTSLRVLSRLLDVDATFISLQKDVRTADRVELDNNDMIDWTAELSDLADTAALIKCLDLVITVDTSVAHLAAALGCPTWILLPWTPDYRWLLGRDDSPWYPTVRLFRQDERRDYAIVVQRVRAELMNLMASR